MKKLNLTLEVRRNDSIPAFGAFLRCEPPDENANAVVFINVEAVMSPELQDDEGGSVAMTREERKRLFITTLMHEFGHALEAKLNLPDCENHIESACEEWEKLYAAQSEQ